MQLFKIITCKLIFLSMIPFVYVMDSPLHDAVFQNDTEKIYELINSENIDVNAQNSFGFTPLHLAVQNQNFDVISALLKSHHKVNVNALDNSGCPPLKLAISSKNIKIVKILIKHGSNIDIKCKASKNKPEMSLLEFARRMRCFDIADLLIKKGAQTNVVPEMLKIDDIPTEPKALLPQSQNWCWMVSVLNCLYRVVPFRKLISYHAYKDKQADINDSLEVYLDNLFRAMRDNSSNKVELHLNSFYNAFMKDQGLNQTGFKEGKCDDSLSFYQRLCRIILSDNQQSCSLYSKFQSRGQFCTEFHDTFLGLKKKFQLENTAPVIALFIKGKGLGYFTQNPLSETLYLTHDIDKNVKKYKLVACVIGGTGHATAYVEYKGKWRFFDSMKSKIIDSNKTIQQISTENLTQDSTRLWFYEQVEPEWNMPFFTKKKPSPLQQRLVNLHNYLQMLKGKLALLKTKIEELKQCLIS